jgi:hypothetical protein
LGHNFCRPQNVFKKILAKQQIWPIKCWPQNNLLLVIIFWPTICLGLKM